MKNINISKWFRFVVNHPYKVLAVIGIITLVFAWQLPNLRFQTSIYDLAIEDLPSTNVYKKFKEEFGSEEIILVVAKTKNVFDPKTFAKIGQLSQEMAEIKGVKRAVSLSTIKKAMDITDKWNLSDFEKIIAPIKLFERNLISADKKNTVITLILEDVEEKDQVIAPVDKIIEREKAGLSMYQIGMPIVSKALAEFTEQDFLTLPPITFAVIAILLFIFFRNLRGIFIPAGSVIIALIWTFGLMALTGIALSMVTMIVPIFLIAVGTAYCMYIFPEYLAAIKDSESPAEASFQCSLQLAFPTSLAVITTTIGLGSLLINKMSAIREFAVFSCFGILSMLIIILTFLPAVQAILPFPVKKTGRKPFLKDLLDRVLSRIISLNLHHQKITLPLIALISFMGILGIYRLRVETNPIDYFRKDTAVSQHFHDIYKDLAGSFPINVVFDSNTENHFEDPENLNEMTRLQQFLDSLDGVDKTISYLDYLKLVNYASNQHKQEYYALPEEPFEVRMLVNNYKTMLGQDMHDRFMNDEFSKLNIMLRTHISSSNEFLAAKKAILNYLRENYPQTASFNVTGFGVVISESSQLLTEGQVKSLFLTLILVFTIMLLLFMSWKVGLIGIAPNCFPIIVNFGLMGWLGVPLSTATSLIASIAIGLAVDDTIHYLVKYNREFKKDLDKERALQDTLRKVGKPIIFTTLTISLGFSILMFSHFRPTAIFGLMMIITMVSALIADLVLLPSLMLHVELITLWDLVRIKLGKDPQKGIPLLDGLSRTQVHYILIAGALRNAQEGEIIFRKGEMSDSMYAVISGELEVVNPLDENDPDMIAGAKQVINVIKTGDVVGEMGMIRSTERMATVLATEPSELLEINDRMVKRLQWLYPPTAQKFFFNLMTTLCDRLENVTQCYIDVTTLDDLTGLHNRTYFMDVLAKEMARSRRYKTRLSIVLMDLDNFRGVNHLCGFKAGDSILTEVGRLLKERVRISDLACRYDGQQFAAILPYSKSEQAYSVCDRFRELLAKQTFKFDANPVYITASFGLATFHPASEKTPQRLVAEALQAVQMAKKAGKNCVKEAIEK